MRQLRRFLLLALDPLGVRSAWGWWRLLSLTLALGGTSGAGAVGLYLEAELGVARGVLAVPLVAIVAVGLFWVAGARLISKLDTYEVPRLELLFIPGDIRFEYIGKSNIGTPSEQEHERVYSVGIHNPGAVTVEQVSVRLESVEGISSDGVRLSDPRPADLLMASSVSGPCSVRPREIIFAEVISRFTSEDQFRLRYAARVDKAQFIPVGRYKLTLAVYCKDAIAISEPERFTVSGDQYGGLRFQRVYKP